MSYKPVLKKSRDCFLKRDNRLTENPPIRLNHRWSDNLKNRANMRNQKEANGPGLILPTDFADETSLFSWQSRRIFSLTLESVASCFSYDSNDSRAAIGNHGDGIERGKTDVGRGVESIAPTAPRSGIFPLAVR